MNITPTREAAQTLAALRSPSARPLRLVHGFAVDSTDSYGLTLEYEAGESVRAPGAGTVTRVEQKISQFSHSAGPLAGTPTFEVTLTHANGVATLIKGLASIRSFVTGSVQRGDVLGEPLTREVFFGISYRGQWVDPSQVNRHFRLQGNYVPAQTGKLRFAPDMQFRDLAENVYAVLYRGIHYFIDRLQGFQPLLVNVDFNGDGTKTGLAATGLTATDYWNVFAAGAFNWTTSYGPGCDVACGQTKDFNRTPQTWLKNASEHVSSVWLERTAMVSGLSGTETVVLDEMGSSWIGGWAGGVPEENAFTLRGLAAGTYALYLFANSAGRIPATGTACYAAVDADVPVLKSCVPTLVPGWRINDNYVRYDLVVPAQGVIKFKTYGYLDGLQLERLT